MKKKNERTRKERESLLKEVIDFMVKNKDMINAFVLDPVEEDELSTPLKEAKVISAWYDIV